MQPIEATTFLLHARRFGAISNKGIINWADSQISNSESPETWLLELTLSRTTNELITLLEKNGGEQEITDQWFLAIVAELYFQKGKNDFETTNLLYERFCLCNPNANQELHEEIYAIDDELNWNQEQASERLQNLLRPYKSAFESRFLKIIEGT